MFLDCIATWLLPTQMVLIGSQTTAGSLRSTSCSSYGLLSCTEKAKKLTTPVPHLPIHNSYIHRLSQPSLQLPRPKVLGGISRPAHLDPLYRPRTQRQTQFASAVRCRNTNLTYIPQLQHCASVARYLRLSQKDERGRQKG